METKFKIIETEEYFLAVSDEDASNSCIYFTGNPTGIFKTGIKYKNEAGDYFYQDAITGMSDTYLTTISKKIIGYQPKGNAPELDLPLLPDIVVEDDVEKLGKQAYKKHSVKDDSFSLLEQIQRSGGFLVGFKEGYKAATKTYSEEDLRKAFEAGNKRGWSGYPDTDNWTQPKFEEFIQSLKQPKWFVAEVEKKMVLNLGIDVRNPNTHVYVNELKTTTINNKIYLVGTYLN
jgi:hypothetical protein